MSPTKAIIIFFACCTLTLAASITVRAINSCTMLNINNDSLGDRKCKPRKYQT
jgi:hypothetical protein